MSDWRGETGRRGVSRRLIDCVLCGRRAAGWLVAGCRLASRVASRKQTNRTNEQTDRRSLRDSVVNTLPGPGRVALG
eukprot:scaffold12017_cov120-Isochrysis_galbana.AAC.7